MNRILNLLGMAQRANKLISGEGFCVDAIRNHEAYVILLASDAGRGPI